LQEVLTVGDRSQVLRLFGPQDAYLKAVRDAFGVKVVARDAQVVIEGPEEKVRSCEDVIRQLQHHLK